MPLDGLSCSRAAHRNRGGGCSPPSPGCWVCGANCSKPTRWSAASPTPRIGVDPADVASVSQVVLDQVLAAGGVEPPVARALAGVGGKKGRSGLHTEALSLLLAEMQSVAREHPLGVW
jgi:ring-1,2-phenylacetyl-CoA epoxidase subunit PaaC